MYYQDMGWASASTIIECQLEYCDQNELWKNNHILKMIEILAIELMENDWDTVEDCYNSRTFREMCQQSTHEWLQDHWTFIQKY